MPDTTQRKALDDALLDYTAAIDGVIDTITEQGRLDVERTFAKREAVATLVGTHNPATNRPHSATSAADAVMDHPDYVDLWKRSREADTNAAVARLTLELARARWKMATMLVDAQFESAELLADLTGDDLTPANEGGIE